MAIFSGSSGDSDVNGQFDYLFASPEALVGDKIWRSKLQDLNLDVSVIVVDEFHTIATWYVELFFYYILTRNTCTCMYYKCRN